VTDTTTAPNGAAAPSAVFLPPAPGEWAADAVSPIDRLRPEPPTLELTDGRRVELMFDMEALAWLEKRTGSLSVLEGLGSDFHQPVLEVLLYVIGAGLRHRPELNVRVLRAADEDGDMTTHVLLGDVRLIRLLDIRRLRDYIRAIEGALEVALPWGKAAAGASGTPAPRSTGGGSTTPEQSFSGAPTPSSGA